MWSTVVSPAGFALMALVMFVMRPVMVVIPSAADAMRFENVGCSAVKKFMSGVTIVDRDVLRAAYPSLVDRFMMFSCTASTMFERMPVTVFDATCIIPPYLPSMPESIAVIPVSASMAPCVTLSRASLTDTPR